MTYHCIVICCIFSGFPGFSSHHFIITIPWLDPKSCLFFTESQSTPCCLSHGHWNRKQTSQFSEPGTKEHVSLFELLSFLFLLQRHNTTVLATWKRRRAFFTKLREKRTEIIKWKQRSRACFLITAVLLGLTLCLSLCQDFNKYIKHLLRLLFSLSFATT